MFVCVSVCGWVFHSQHIHVQIYLSCQDVSSRCTIFSPQLQRVTKWDPSGLDWRARDGSDMSNPYLMLLTSLLMCVYMDMDMCMYFIANVRTCVRILHY